MAQLLKQFSRKYPKIKKGRRKFFLTKNQKKNRWVNISRNKLNKFLHFFVLKFL